MKLKNFLMITLLASGFPFFTACAVNGHERAPNVVMSDGAITAKVKSALLTEKDVKSFDISVETFNGTVQLSGFVNSQWQIDKATDVASAVSGVKHVKNNLIHKPL